MQSEGRTTLQMPAGTETRQAVVDAIQSALSSQRDWRLTSGNHRSPATRRRRSRQAQGRERKRHRWHDPRRNLEHGGQAKVDQNYVVFVILSTIVAALGMLTNSVAVVVGAMVIAPLLGPNLAFSVGVALGDGSLIARALLANAVGVGLALILSVGIGFFWEGGFQAQERRPQAPSGYSSGQVNSHWQAVRQCCLP